MEPNWSWKVYCRSDGRYDFIPQDEFTSCEVIKTDLALSDAMALTDELNNQNKD